MYVKRAVLVAALIAPLITGCDEVVTGRPLAGGSVEWGSCPDLPDFEVPAEAQCGEVLVPLDYSKPDDARATIAVARLPATGEKIGSLLLNFGGPGLSGADTLMYWTDYYPADVREHFDVVGFDPRGIGLSTARGGVQLRCRRRHGQGGPRRRQDPSRSRGGRRGDSGVRAALRREVGRRGPGQRRHRGRRQGIWTCSGRRSATTS